MLRVAVLRRGTVRAHFSLSLKSDTPLSLGDIGTIKGYTTSVDTLRSILYSILFIAMLA
jgi:hypothetical protein